VWEIDEGEHVTADLRHKNHIKLNRSQRWRDLAQEVADGYFDPLTGLQNFQATRSEARWFEFALQAMWPFVTKAVERFIMGDLSTLIREQCADIPMLDKFRFTSCNLGDRKPTIGSIKSVAGADSAGFIFNLIWEAVGAEIEVEVGSRLRAGMKDLRLEGNLMLTLAPLLDMFPITGGLSISFTDPPELTWRWTGIGKAFNFRTVHKAIVDALFHAIVVPNRVFCDIATASGLVAEAEKPRMVDYMSPRPLGVLRIEVLAARDLSARDLMGTSDPYVVMRVGSGEYMSKTLYQTLNPHWGEFQGQDFMVYDLEQQVFIDVWDEDRISQDETLGSVIVEPHDGGKLRRPIVAELTECPQAWWKLDLRGTGHEHKHKSEILLRCHFATPSQMLMHVKPTFVTCPEHCGLHHVTQGERLGNMKCALCSKNLAQSWKAWLQAKEPAHAKVCTNCNYGVCSDCAVQRRPACGLLRIILKSARVPVEDASKGPIVSFEFEGTTLRSHKAQHSIAEATMQYVQKAEVANNLHWSANLDAVTIAKCLGMSTDEVEYALNKRLANSAKKLELRTSDYDVQSATQSIVWDQAFHFLVKDPIPDELERLCSVKVVYSVSEGMFPKKSDRHLGSTHPICSKGTRTANAVEPHMTRLQESVTWKIGTDHMDTIDLQVDICLEPLTVQDNH